MLSKIKKLLQFRIKRWHVAMWGWDEKDIRVLICLEDVIWYWAVLEWLFWDVQTYVCHYSDFIKLPKWVRNIRGHWDDDDPEYEATWEDWYGDSLHSIWHCNVCDPLLQWVWKHKDFHKAWPQWELTLDEAREKFAHDPEIWEWVEKALKEHKEYDAEKAAEKLE